jgi:hypothetical protein
LLDVKKLKRGGHDFLVVGGPTGAGMMSLTVGRFVDGKASGSEWRNKPSRAFGTNFVASVEKNGQSAAERIAEKLGEKRSKQVLPVLRPAGLDAIGPLMEREVEKAKEWACELATGLGRK